MVCKGEDGWCNAEAQTTSASLALPVLGWPKGFTEAVVRVAAFVPALHTMRTRLLLIPADAGTPAQRTAHDLLEPCPRLRRAQCQHRRQVEHA
jgi:hypothetical protein